MRAVEGTRRTANRTKEKTNDDVRHASHFSARTPPINATMPLRLSSLSPHFTRSCRVLVDQFSPYLWQVMTMVLSHAPKSHNQILEPMQSWMILDLFALQVQIDPVFLHE